MATTDMKKTALVFLLSAALLLACLSGCSQREDPPVGSKSSAGSEIIPAPTPEPTPIPTPEPTPEPTPSLSPRPCTPQVS